MKTSHCRSFVSAALLTALLAGCADNTKPHPVMVPWATLPVPVQKTINAQIPDQNITMAELETKDGATVYEAKAIKADGSKQIVEVDPDGKLLATRTISRAVKLSWKHVPKAARKTILANANGMKTDSVEKETDNDVVIYKAKFCNPDGSEHIVKVDKNGKLIAVRNK